MVGRVFNNRYQLTDRIGLGGMAEVYRAQDRVLGRMVAVKIMLQQYAEDPEFTQRFRQEAAAAANLQSPYIVNVYDWGQDEGTYYIVMEYVRGSDLKTAINQRGAINQRKVAEIGAQVCQALSVAHNQDIIHRDVKPQNIMIQPDGNVKVMDFGIARSKNAVKSQTSAVLGTAHYISPEQAQGKELTAASDIYSLGVVMYEAVTGTLPFDGPDAVSVAMKQVNEMPTPPSELNPNLDPNLESIIMRALQKDPRARFETVTDMKHALNDFLAGRSVNVAAPASYTNDVTSMMTPVAAAAAAGAAGAFTAEDAAAAQQAKADKQKAAQEAAARKKAEEEAASKKKKKIAAIVLGTIAALCLIGGLIWALMPKSGTVPDVTGMTVEQATSAITAAGYEVGEVTETFSSNVDEGLVTDTDPRAGTEASHGTKVNLVVSKGPDYIEVPDLSEMTELEAEAALTKLGLNAQKGESQYSDEVEEGKIVAQSPQPGSKVEKGSTVTYNLSRGKEMVSVPNVVGMTESEAAEALEAKGLTGSVSDYQSSTSVPQGQIISQNPTAGSDIDKGATVTYVVSSGEPTYEVPSVIGYSESSARNAIEGKGFTWGGTSSEYSDTVDAGSVISQSPSAGTYTQKGTSVSVVISLGPDPNAETPTQQTPDPNEEDPEEEQL